MTHPLEFMIYHLYEWDAAREKYKKKPVGLDGSPLTSGGGIPTSPSREAVQATCDRLGSAYRVGLWLREGCGMFFLDLDEDAVANGALTPSATEFAAELVAAGCYFEASSSGRGAHVIGRYHVELPPHSVQRPLDEPAPHALYVGGRGCVLAAPGEPTLGSWDVDATPALLRLLAAKFPPRATGVTVPLGVGPRAEWRGPADDDILIARMLSATGSAAARMGGKLSFAQLWRGECSHDNESDMALASHLAFWTGADPARIERLMRRSPLAAHRIEKWDSHRTYLQELTITKACTTTLTVYQEPQRVDTLTALLGGSRPAQPVVGLPPPVGVTDAVVLGAPAPPAGLPAPVDWLSLSDDVIKRINECGTLRSLREEIMPSLSGYGFPSMDRERIVTALNKKLDVFDARQPLAVLRSLLTPPVDASVALTPVVPDWAQPLIYNQRTDKFFNTVTGSHLTHQGVRIAYSRFMPVKPAGGRDDPVEALSSKWNVENVDDLEYRPDQPTIFDYAGMRFGNLFRPSTMPTPAVPSAECEACIGLFQAHLAAVVNQRAPLYAALLGWIAHNVQKPGVKIFWSPLIKGVQGDGKSIFGELLRNTLGQANVKVTSASSVANKGGFTDWAAGKAVNVIEEIKLEGKESRALYNNMKTLVGDKQIDINRKGRPSGDNLENVTNHWANTQHANAVPVEEGERRWLVVFTPWASAAEAARMKGLLSAEELPGYFERIGSSMRAEPGAWRSWLLGIDLSTFKANGRALWTPERESMASGSEDYVEQTIRDVIDRGGRGITKDVFDSAYLMGRVTVELGEKSDTRTWNKTLTHLGYQQITRLMWDSKTRRIWAKFSMTNSEVVERLDKTL